MTDEPVLMPADAAAQPWARSSRDARFGGVCSGIARRQHLDPVLVRVLFVLLALSAGLGFVLYAAAYAFWPDDAGRRPPIEKWLPQARTWTNQRKWVATTVVALLCMSTLGTALPFTLGPALVVLVAWRVSRRQAERPVVTPGEQPAPLPETPLSPEFDAATLAWRRRIAALEGGWAPGPEAVAPAHVPTPAFLPQYRDPDPLGIYAPVEAPAPVASRPRFRTTLLILLVAAGAGGLGYTVPNVDNPWRLGVAGALSVIAVALLVGTRTGRPRLLVLVGLLLSGAAFLPSAPAGVHFATPVNGSYSNGSALPADFTVAFTEGTLNLSDLTLTSSATLPVTCAGGSLEILLPKGVRTTIPYEHVGTSLTLPGSPTVSNNGTWTSTTGDERTTLTLPLEAVGCEVTVR